jgi:hypothetical protein
MALYKQPNTDQYALQGYSFLRLKQLLATPGDIFESQQGAHAFALGPDSDISQVNVGYYDGQVTDFFSQFTLTPQRAFESLITAFNKTKLYAPSKVPARILIWPAEIYDSTYLPIGFTPNSDQLVFEPPAIDILQFFSPPPSISSVRADKTYYYDILPFGNDDCYVALPFYGRRYASIVMHNSSADMTCQVSVKGVNFRISEDAALEIPLLTAFTLGFAESTSRVVTANYDSRIGEAPPLTNANAGLFDYLLLQFNPAGGPAVDPVDISLRVVVSDTPP